MKLIITRHGATDHNISRLIQGQFDTPLNTQGKTQAQELAEALLGEKIDVIYSSDLQRARMTTMAILQTQASTAVYYTDQLRERHYGEFQNGPLSKLLAAKVNFIGDWDAYQPIGGESQYQFHDRIHRFWQDVLKRHTDETLLFSVHGGVAKSLITHVLGKDMAYRRTLIQDNCCLNILNGDESTSFRAEVLNSVDHLSAPTGLEGL